MKIYQVMIAEYYDNDEDLIIGYATTEMKAKDMINVAKAIYGYEQSYAYFSTEVDMMIINGSRVMF